MFCFPWLLREITVSYLKVKVALFVPNPVHFFNCNKFGHMSWCCKVAAKCQWCRKDKHEGQCEGPKLCFNCNGSHASSAQDCSVWQKKKEIQRICIEKHVFFLEARQFAEARMPTVIASRRSFSAVVSTRTEMKSVECQMQLTWVFSHHPLRTVQSSMRASGGPGLVSANTQASSRKSGLASADALGLCKSMTCSKSSAIGSADPSKMASKGSANPSKTASNGSTHPPKTACKGSAGPSKNCALDGWQVIIEGHNI